MNKKLTIIVAFMLLTIQYAFAEQEIYNDVVTLEDEPQLTSLKEDNKKSFKTIFRRNNNKKSAVKKGTEANAVLKSDVTSNNKNTAETVDKIKSQNNNNNTQNKSELSVFDNEISADIQANIDKLEVISLDDCLKIAMEYNPLIKSAYSNTQIYKSKIAQAWSAYFPSLSIDLNYSKNKMLGTFMQIPSPYNVFYVPQLSANMLIFDFGKTKALADISKRTYEASEYQLAHSIDIVVYNVKQSYYNLLFALQQQEVYEETVKDYELHLEQAKAYYEIGTKPKIDVITAEYNLGKAQLNLIKAKNTVNIAYAHVSNAMGLPGYKNYNISDKLDNKVYNINLDEALNTAFETSPEFLAEKKKLDAADLLVKSSFKAFLPDVKAFGSFSNGGKNPNYDYGYQFGAGFSYNTFNAMLLKKKVDEAKATQQKELADFNQLKQTIYLNVEQAYLDLITAQDSIRVAKLSMDQAHEQYDLASGRYKVGLGDAIELKDAETTYRNSQLDYYNNLLQYNISAANLEKIIGAPLKATNVDLL